MLMMATYIDDDGVVHERPVRCDANGLLLIKVA